MAKTPNFPKGKTMNPALRAMREESRNRVLINSAMKATMILSMMVLDNEFEFKQDEMQRYRKRLLQQLRCWRDGNITSYKEFVQVLNEDYGITEDDLLNVFE